MKKLFLLIVITMMCALNNSICAQSYTVNGNSYSTIKTSKSSTEVQTPYTFNVKGVEYPIFLSANGCAYIKRISQKSGQEYRQYLGADISRDICSKMKIEYKGK